MLAAANQGAGQTYTVLHSFDGTNGALPHYGLVRSDSVLYGVTPVGGVSNLGTIYRLNMDGSGYRVLKSFLGGSDGRYPEASLAISGTHLFGAANGSDFDCGAVFRINTDGGDFTVLKKFTGQDGRYPQGNLVLAGDTLYGTTLDGGAENRGTIYKINADGSGFSVVRSFRYIDGSLPGTGLVLDGDTLYGTVLCGTSELQLGGVYRVGIDGNGYALLKDFDSHDNDYPFGGIVLAGATIYGTTGRSGNIFCVDTNGANFRVLHYTSPLGYPYGGLTLSGSTLYGTDTSVTGGRVFQIETNGGGFRVLKAFNGSDGDLRLARCTPVLVGATMYAVTEEGGAFDKGVVFALSLIPSLRLQIEHTPTAVSRLSFNGLAGNSYTVEAAPEPAGPWNFVTNTSPRTNGVWSFEDNGASATSRRFYRVSF